MPDPVQRRALDRLLDVPAEARVPPRRLAELSRYGMTASASLIRRHGDARRLATLLNRLPGDRWRLTPGE